MKKQIVSGILTLAFLSCVVAPAVTCNAAHQHKWKKVSSKSITANYEYKKWIIDNETWVDYDVDYEAYGLECKDCGRFFETYYGKTDGENGLWIIAMQGMVSMVLI